MNTIKNQKIRTHEGRSDLAGEYRWGDAGQIVLVIIFILGICIDKFVLKIQTPFNDLIPFYVQISVAAILLLIGGIIIKTGHNLVFGQKREKLTVIKNGLFSYVRHPLYLGAILLFLGFTILSFSTIAFVIWLIILIFFTFLSLYEEKILIEKIGDEYKNYMKETPMFIPKIRKRK